METKPNCHCHMKHTVEVHAGLVISRRDFQEIGNSPSNTDTDIGWAILAEARSADGCNLRLRIPLSSPLSVLRLGVFPSTDSRNETDPGTGSSYAPLCDVVQLRTSRRAGKTLVSLRIHTHLSWSRDSASPYRAKIASLHSGISRRNERRR